MSHLPTQSSPDGGSGNDGKQHHAPPPPSTPNSGIHQSHSFSSYHPPPPPPPPSGNGYYYHASNPYPPHHQPHLSPTTTQYGAHHPPYPYHHPQSHHRHQHHHGHQPYRSDAPSWPAPPSASSFDSPPQIESSNAMDIMTSSSERSPSPPPETTTTVAEASAASTLSTLANAASAHSQSPSPTSDSPTSSAGPLKKRRKVEKATTGAQAVKDGDAPSVASSPPPDNSPCSSPTNMDSSPTVTSDSAPEDILHFPSLLHKLLCKGGDKESDVTAISSAMEWLPHGKGWRVLRWDVLCSEVLPTELPQLCEGLESKKENGIRGEERKVDDDDRDDSSHEKKDQFGDEQWIEAFLRHAKAWGFEEVMAGRDRGSFRHELFVKDSPEKCHQMRFGRVRSNSNSILSLTPTYSTVEISHSSSNLDAAEHSTAWRKSHKVVSSIFKPRRHHHQQHHNHHHQYNPAGSYHHHHHRQHPAHLNVPALTPTATASFAEGWGATDHSHHGHNQQHYPPPYPPPTRSPKTIRFRDEAEPTPFNQRDDAIEITPNPEVSPSPRRNGGDRKGFHRGFVSRRGRRPGLISRHATH